MQTLKHDYLLHVYFGNTVYIKDYKICIEHIYLHFIKNIKNNNTILYTVVQCYSYGVKLSSCKATQSIYNYVTMENKTGKEEK